MPNKIILKHKEGASGAPGTADLDLGELALNTFDGKAYMKKSDGTTESIVEIGGGTSGAVVYQGGWDATSPLPETLSSDTLTVRVAPSLRASARRYSLTSVTVI